MGRSYLAEALRQTAGGPIVADVLIVGASVRAAAESALRSGLAPLAVDLFADRDLVAKCPTVPWSGHWHGLPAFLATAPARQWMYTGGLENYPEVLDAGAQCLPLVGCAGEAVRRVKDPRWLALEFRRGGIPFPAPSATAHRSSTERVFWVRKEYRSAGGGGVRWASHHEVTWSTSLRSATSYIQPFVPGESQAALFLASGGAAQLVGVTRQWVGEPWLAARPFQYCGSLGPLAVTGTVEEQWRRVGDWLASRADLTGLFGVDGVVDAQQTLWPIEVNPRYPASAEVFERSWGFPAVGAHVATDESQLTTRNWRGPSNTETGRCLAGDAVGLASGRSDARDGLHTPMPAKIVGKAILFAPAEVRINETFSAYLDRTNAWSAEPVFADLPSVGQIIAAGQPILSVFAEGDDEALVVHRLRRRVEWLYRYLQG